MADAAALRSAVVELTVGAAAAGGSCVARLAETGRVVFVRHALPGERVRAQITEDRGGRFCRADAVEVVTASPERVEPPCPYAGPGRCGGCDWQHASGAAQRELKATVIHDQFARIAGIDVGDVFDGVTELPGGLLGWRTRITYAVDSAGQPGLRRHASHAVQPVTHCLLGVPGVGDASILHQDWPGLSGVEAVRGDDGAVSVLAHRPGRGKPGRGRRPPDRVELVSGPAQLRHLVGTREFVTAAGGFWQVHPAAAAVLAEAVLEAVEPVSAQTVLDLYAGAGAFTAALAQAVGAGGRVVGIEADAQAVADAATNLAGLPWAEVRTGRVTAEALTALDIRPDVVVLDPPRAGAGEAVVQELIKLAPRVIGYVSCDPGTLARDVAAATRSGWRMTRLRAVDAFPMTHHVECVATLAPLRSAPPRRAG